MRSRKELKYRPPCPIISRFALWTDSQIIDDFLTPNTTCCIATYYVVLTLPFVFRIKIMRNETRFWKFFSGSDLFQTYFCDHLECLCQVE